MLPGDRAMYSRLLKYHHPENVKTAILAILLVGSVMYSCVSMAGAGLDRLREFFDDLQSLKADFTQTVLDARSTLLQDASGKFALLRPGRFRWDYQTPYKQLIVSDGKRIQIYDPDLEQVTVKMLDQTIGNMPALLLSNEQPLGDSFNITELGMQDGLEWLELIPKQGDTSFEKIRLAFDEHTLHAMELFDSFGQTTRLVFSNVQRNPAINPQIFQFTPPPDVDVVGDIEE
jgi:outer membrane lipoprotein carrier protein